MRVRNIFGVALFALTLVACIPTPTPAPPPSGDVYQDACDAMARLGDADTQAEGRAPDCAKLLEEIDAAGILSSEAPCLARAETRAQLDGCYADDIE